MAKYFVDDRGNVAEFYHRVKCGDMVQVATLDREGGEGALCDSVYTWDGGQKITRWARNNGYRDEIAQSVRVVTNEKRKRFRIVEGG